ncbi:hypothetical protein LR69_01699 [Geobacillus sp. BCO2]|nr:hypothetical protein LR69_01699 [Geobacillus sp. BCO2]
MRYYIVFDIGGTYVKHAVMNEHGDFFEKGRYRSERHDFHQFRDDLLNVVRQAQANYPLSGIAISSAGAWIATSASSAEAAPCLVFTVPTLKTYSAGQRACR